MGEHEVFLINEIGGSIGNCVGEKVKKEFMKGSEKLTANSSAREIAEWLKGAMERLDALVDEETRIRIMEPLGYHCADGGYPRKWIDEAREERKKYKNLDEFLEAKAEEWGYAREGDVVYHTITKPPPGGARCVCMGKGLPAEETMSRTYCLCSRGLVKRYWEEVLGRPLEVELVHSAISGAEECKFAVHL